MKKVIIAMLVGTSLSAKVFIEMVDNSSGVDICLTNGRSTINVYDGESKRVKLELACVDPKILFQDVVLNRSPKIPNNALRVTVQGKIFYLWVDPRGVVVARDKQQPDVSNDETLSQTALKLSPQEQAKLIACVLLVNQDGVKVSKR